MHVFRNPAFHKSIIKKKLYSEKYNTIIHIREKVCYNCQVKLHRICMQVLNTN